ncbi:aquaporin-like protein [Truncatella angustata]|uniref:Aquaporin-like protein n=1 Tax=Truncatella angustata TaxID=152316 RepID=A0A9P8UHP0_9PEZI|nr:aquaporin-like protein [Truncatella angustata]KAH6652553.1 aquaporin-like protein [Truncatella angustata]KAH8200169.1 hypothetical protein TruAng_005681 [Truncatella angustata]
MSQPTNTLREQSHQSGSEPVQSPGSATHHRLARPALNLHRGQNFSSFAASAYTAGRRDRDQQSHQGTLTSQPDTQRLSWIDDEYIKQNPWHDKSKDKPVFSLGGPLPHIARGSKKHKNGRGLTNEELAERGELQSDKSGSEQHLRSPSTQPINRDQGARTTVAGTDHGGGRNAGGQPVFDYTHGQGSHSPSNTDNTQPEFKIDGEPLGKREHDDVVNEDKNPDEYRNWWAKVRAKHPEPLAEFLATLVAIFLGLSGTLSVFLSQDQAIPYGSYETSCWAWGFAWMFGVYLGGGVSGAHMNPAISISLSVFRGFPWLQCLIYVIVQFIAAIVAGALAYGVFYDTMHNVDPTLLHSSKAFLSTPQTWVSPGNAFLNQSVGSAIMMIVVFALGDDQNNPPGAGMHAFVLGLLVSVLKMTLGFNIGSALNPASDFGPRVIAYAIGYREANVFSDPWWFYGPWAATLVGSLVGCVIYDTFIFVGSESPVNYKYPPTIRKKIQQKGSQVLDKLGSS